MKRIRDYVVALLAAGTVAAAALPGCATNDQSIFISGVLAPSSNRQGGACIFNADPQQTRLFGATVDIGLTSSYIAVLLVGNQLISRGDPNNNRAESNRAHINGAVVRITEPDGVLIREFTSLATGFNDPQNNNAPGYGVVGVPTLDAATASILAPLLPNRAVAKTVAVNVKVFGTTLGGVDLESGEYQFPLQVCKGCLVNFDGLDPAKVTPNRPDNCDKPADANATESTTGPCFLGQDRRISCRLCQGLPVCDPNVD